MKSMDYTPNETGKLLKDVFEANDKLISEGKMPVSICITGVHGIGKSTVSIETCEAVGKPWFKLNLAQLTEPAELTGYKQRESQMIKNEEEVWVPENLIPTFVSQGYKYTGKIKTVDCAPEWVHNLKEGSVLILDDFSRGNILLIQAVMELIQSHEMLGWDLKSKKIQIILNENPSDGSYNVSSLDDAQNDRMGKITMVWNHKDWTQRAEQRGTDGRLINFVLWKPELFENRKQDGIPCSGNISPRMMDKFFDLIGTFQDFENNMDKITAFGDITVGRNVVTELQLFIKGNLDKLPNIDDLIKKDSLKAAKEKLTAVCGIETVGKGQNKWKHATAAILATRMYNYIKINANILTKADCIQYRELVYHNCFGNDHKYLMIQTVLVDSKDLSSIFFEDSDSRALDLVFE